MTNAPVEKQTLDMHNHMFRLAIEAQQQTLLQSVQQQAQGDPYPSRQKVGAKQEPYADRVDESEPGNSNVIGGVKLTVKGRRRSGGRRLE